jgi:hypothetical protein
MGRTHEIGAGSFFHSFFSTVVVRLERDSWGSRFPIVMKSLWEGEVPAAQVGDGLKELAQIREELKAFPPSEVVWSFKDRNAKPPWGDNIAPTITSLANYFVTADGKDLFDVLLGVFETARKKKLFVRVE